MDLEIIKQFDGYEDVVREAEVCRKYGLDYNAEGGAEPVVRLYHPDRLNLRVAEVIEEAGSAKTLRLVSEDGYLPPFLAGQYIALYVQVGGIRTGRPYSIASPPNQTGYYDLTVRRVPEGLVSNYLLDEVKPGHRLESSGPAGHFHHNPLFHDSTMICLAGGSGITPFASMIREVLERGLDRTIYLFYGNKRLGEAIYHDRLMDLSRHFDNFIYIPVVEEPEESDRCPVGLITAGLIRDMVGEVKDKTFYLCGPRAMYDFCVPELEKLEAPRRKIIKEVYGAPLDVQRSPGWPEAVRADDTFPVRVGGRTVQARAGESLLTALEKSGLAPPSVCRSGECSLCRVKLVSGRVFQPSGVSLRKADQRFGYVHACVSYPLEELEILL